MDFEITNLGKLLEIIKSVVNNGASQGDVLAFLLDLCRKNEMNLHYDMFTLTSDTVTKIVPAAPVPPAVTETTAAAMPPTVSETAAAAMPPAVTETTAATMPPAVTETTVSHQKKRKNGRSAKIFNIPVNIDKYGYIQFGDVKSAQDIEVDAECESHSNARNGSPRELNEGYGRIILSCNRRNISMSTRLPAECNGVVIDAFNGWKVLAVPPFAFNPRPVKRRVDMFLEKGVYDVLRVTDGTIVTIYAWTHPVVGKIWCISSGNGYDVSAYKWLGELTYAEIVYNLLSQYDTNEHKNISIKRGILGPTDVRIDFENMSDEFSYTIGFHYHDFHPLIGDDDKAWQIHHINLSTMSAISSVDGLSQDADNIWRAIPWQAPMTANELAHELPAGAPLTYGALVTSCKNSLIRVEEFMTKRLSLIANGESPPHPGTDLYQFGYILRSKNRAETLGQSDILIESPLLAGIRNIIYNKPPRDIRDKLTNINRMDYNIMRSYLNSHMKDHVVALFPQFVGRFNKYASFVENVISLVISMMRQEWAAYNRNSTRQPSLQRSKKTPTVIVAQAILNHIKDVESINPFKTDYLHDRVKDYVMQPEHALMYMKALSNEE